MTVVDMRWGVRDEATDDHQTVNLCSREIKNCQRMSLGPNFVALLGDKYGFRPLCNKIKSTEYRAIRRCLIEQDINTDFLDTWYKEDQNAVPAEYLLQPISSILKNFTNKKEPELQALDQRIWQAIQERLHELLMIGSNRLVKQGRMSEQEQLMKYSISVTEREVIEGCLDLQDAKSHCLVYERSIVDLRAHLDKCLANLTSQLASNLSPTNPADSKVQSSFGLDRKDSTARKASLKIGNDMISLTTSVAQNAAERRVDKTRRLIGRYIDLNSKDGIWGGDEEAQCALANLKEIKLEGKLKACWRNLTKYKVHWHEQEGVSLKSEEHKHYLNELTEHFYTNMTRMIRRACRSEQANFKSGLIGEVLQHSHYANHVSKTFHGRADDLDKIGKYILSSDRFSGSETDRQSGSLPMLIYGVGGSGKTSLLARTATLASDWIAAGSLSSRQGKISRLTDKNYTQEERWDQKACIIMRFCCTTPSSSSMVGVLTSVCRQLQFNFYQYGPLNGTVDRDCSLRTPIEEGRKSNASVLSESQVDNVSDEADFEQEDPEQTDERREAHRGRMFARLRCEPQLAYQSIPEDFVRLAFTFRQLLDNCQHPLHRKRLFVIILDSVERLSSPAESSVEVKYSWLTSITRLPPNVRLIVSCSSESAISGGAEESRTDDYRHLKRRFLRSYLNRRRSSDASTSTNMRSHGPLDGEVAGSIEAPHEEPTNSATDPQRYQLLQRVIAPVVRLKRGLDKTGSSGANNGSGAGSEPERRVDGSALQLKSPPNRWSILKSPVRRLFDGARSATSHQGNQDLLDSQADLSPGWRGHADSNATANKRAEHVLDGVYILHVRPMGVELALNVVQRWLSEVGRNLTKQQWSIVEKSFSSCSRPIFVKLAFGEIVNWKSYSMPSDAKSLTFGSSLLQEGNLSQSGKLLHSDLVSCDKDLMRLLESSGALSARQDETERDEDVGVSEELKWQILTMEQQWLNYLDYKQREQQQLADHEGANGQAKLDSGKRGQLEQEVVIRVGTVQTGGRSDNPNSTSGASSVSASICHLSSTIDEAICQLFARIELHHGYVLTKHSLSYITAARNGICENELEDLLSLDDVVLDDVFQYHLPPVRRIPPLLWTRIRNDLPDYLSERDADGIVINWHHSQFKQVTQKRYLSDPQQVFYIHSLLADYFLGKWADKAKPFRCTKQQIQMAAEQLESAVQQSIRDSQSFGHPARPSAYASGRLSNGSVKVRSGVSFSRLRSSQQDQRLHLMQAKADRRVPHQPLYYAANVRSNGSTSGETDPSKTAATEQSSGSKTVGQGEQVARLSRRYNLRKLTELPYHLIKSGRFIDLASNVLFNYKWLYAALDSIGLQCLLVDFNEASRALERNLRELEDSGEPLSGANKGGAQRLNVINEALDLEWREVSAADELEADELSSMIGQLNVLESTMRLSCSAIQSDTQMLGPQLVGRLLPLVQSRPPTRAGGESSGASPMRPAKQAKMGETNYLAQLLEQCDKDACFDCALSPTDHCLQSPDGLQLSSLEGHSFAIMSMAMGADQRHLLAVSNRFIMWDISTGEVSRDIDPKIEGSIMKELRMGHNNEYAIAYTSNSLILVLDILTQQVSKFDDFGFAKRQEEQICGLHLVDRLGAKEFVVWTSSKWFLMRLVDEQQSLERSAEAQQVSVELVYCADLGQIRAESERLQPQERILSVRLCNDKRDHCHVAFVELQREPSDDAPWREEEGKPARLVLATVVCRLESGAWRFARWPASIEASSLALDYHHRQLVFSDCSGNIYLSRRRRFRWSRAKLIAASRQTTGGSVRQSLHSQTAGEGGLLGDYEHPFELADMFDSPEADGAGSSAPLAIELDSPIDSSCLLEATEESLNDRLAALERRIDAIQAGDEIEGNWVFAPSSNASQQELQDEADSGHRKRQATGMAAVNLIKLYFGDRITVVKLDSELADGKRQRSLLLPKNVRNISVELNRCQMKSVIVGADEPNEEYLVAAVGRRLLLYSLYSEQFLRSIDAHAGRIVQLMSLQNGAQNRHQSGGSKQLAEASKLLCVASASMDKTVKIWNLSNVNKEVHLLDKLDSSISVLSLAAQRPLAACLTRSQLGVYDWRTMKLLARLEQGERLESTGAGEAVQVGARMVRCRLSSNGRYLALATLDAIHLVLLSEPEAELKSRSRLEEGSPSRSPLQQAGAAMALRSAFKQPLNIRASVRRLQFFAQDSRLMAVLECGSQQPMLNRQPRHSSTELDSATISSEQTGSLSWRPFRRILVQCLSVPDGRLQYSIDYSTPTQQSTNESHYLAAGGQLQPGAAERRPSQAHSSELGGDPRHQSSQRVRLPVITRDQLLLVTVEQGGSEEPEGSAAEPSSPTRNRRKSSSQLKLATLLKMYSTRDGALMHSINLSLLDLYNPRQVKGAGDLKHRRSTNPALLGLARQSAEPGSGAAKAADWAQQLRRSVSIGGEQFSRLKPVHYHQRASVVALIDEHKGSSFLVDVQAKQLMACLGNWNGKLSSEGRFGLSRMFKSAAVRAEAGLSSRLGGTESGSGGGLTDGIQLLEMRRATPVKSLLSFKTMALLSGSESLQTTGSDLDVSCGFTRPNDSYVYFYLTHLRRLLLVRLADAQLVANYKLPIGATKLRCSADGLAIVLALQDGSITSLAIVDPQKNDTLLRLAQYPSRKRN